jgi:drug/metabolite transporter (DMT)-like permease
MPNESHKPSRALVSAAFGVVYVVWGSTYLGIRFAVETIPPFLLGGVRFLIAGTALAVWALARGAPRPTKTNWKAAAIAGILLFPFGNGVVVWSETRIDSGMAALLVAVEPFWVGLLLWLGGGDRPRPAVIAGLIAGFVGLVVLLGPSITSQTGSIDLFASLALVAAACAWALGSLYGRSAPLPRSAPMAAGLQMITGSIVLLIISASLGEIGRFDPATVTTRSIVSMLYLILFGSILAFSAYSWLMVTAAPARVATYAYVNPVIAVLLGWAVAGEPMSPRVGVAAAIIVGAVALITAGQRGAEDRGPRKDRGQTPNSGDLVITRPGNKAPEIGV